jgi:hypothetical protein
MRVLRKTVGGEKVDLAGREVLVDVVVVFVRRG